MITGLKKKHEKGYTLVELLVVVAIIGMVAVSAGAFFISSLQSFNLASDQVKVQEQAENAMDMLTEKLMEMHGVYALEDASRSAVDINGKSGWNSAGRIVMGDGLGTYLAFEAGTDNETGSTALYYGTGGSTDAAADTKAAWFLEELKLRPMPAGQTFGSCSGLEINIKCKKGDAEITLNNEIAFRN